MSDSSINKVQCSMTSPLGTLYLVASDRGLCALSFEKMKVPFVRLLQNSHKTHAILQRTINQLTEYFLSQRTTFEIDLDVEGTAFQKKVWKQLMAIPFGSTVAYRDVARKIGHVKAMRAVGSANGRNPICIIVPCHRVISSSGELGGYSAGIERKKKLLRHEQVFIND